MIYLPGFRKNSRCSEIYDKALFSNQLMNDHMIGKVLQARYQVIQSLGAGVFGDTYIALDREYSLNTKCTIKHIKSQTFAPGYLDSLRFCFLNEAGTLHRLGSHPQIPKFIGYFEENEQFYLVQEFVEGHSLSKELPISGTCGGLWTEPEVIELLEDVLGILDFVHAQGVIHCHIKPENLIRRTVDGKLALIDFGLIESVNLGEYGELPIYNLPVNALGYISPEQFIGLTQPNSDIYALGLIAIQALTGLEPLQLKLNLETNEIIWRTEDTSVSDQVAAILSKMISYDYQDRFQSAAEVLYTLREVFLTPKIPLPLHQITRAENQNPQLEPSFGRSSPGLSAMKVGLAANSLLVGLAACSLMNNSPAYSETERLYIATEEYQTGNFQKALALAESIPPYSNVYPEAQANIGEWQEKWQLAAQQYEIVQKALDEERWSDVLSTAAKLPDILYWQSKIDTLVQQAQVNIARQTHDLLSKAYAKAIDKEFSAAIEYLGQIPPESPAGALVQEKLAEYDHKRQIRAAYFLHRANIKASVGDWNGAIQFLRKIHNSTSVYPQAQAKLNEYTQKQQLQNRSVSVAFNALTAKNDRFHPQNDLQEVNIR